MTAPDQYDRLPPHSLDAEQQTLGALVMTGNDDETFARIARHVEISDFYPQYHQQVFDALEQLYHAKKPRDSVMLKDQLAKMGLLEDVGGVEFIADMMGSIITTAHGEHYAKIVREKSQLRRLIDACSKSIEAAYAPHVDAAEVVSEASRRLIKLAAGGSTANIRSIGQSVADFIERRRQMVESGGIAIETGFGPMDREFRGLLLLGGYTLVAARPSMGKSTWVRHALLTLARAGTPVGLIAVEESEDKVAGNAISSITSIENSRIAYGPWSEGLLQQMADAGEDLQDVPLYVTEQATTLRGIVATAQAMARDHGCRVIAVDHLHLVSAPNGENRTQQLTQISSELKHLWKSLNVAGLVAAQLSRPAKGQVVKAPHLNDLRESGALEEHADVVLMLHREDYYHRGEEHYQPDRICEVHVRKNRNGAVGAVDLIADLEHQRFIDPDEDDNRPIPEGI